MSNPYKIIDQSTWERSMHCMVFRNAVQPQYCVSLELDITNFRQKGKQKGNSFTLAFIHAVAKCANDITEFRYRFKGEDVVLYDSIDTSFTYMNKDTQLFKVINAPFCSDMNEYIKKAEQIMEEQKEYFTGPVPDDMFQFSALPWITFTHVSHTESGQKDKAQPMFDWGKYYERHGKLILPFSVQVHHSFVDGIHIGKLVQHLQEYLDSYE